MGWFINYEVDFLEEIEWDSEKVKKTFVFFEIDVDILFLRDLNYKYQRCIVCLYSHYEIEQVLAILWSLYQVKMKHNIYLDECPKIYPQV